MGAGRYSDASARAIHRRRQGEQTVTSQQTGGLKPTRRTLVKGAAWSVPVVAMGQPVMAVASSPNDPVPPPVPQPGSACKHPGNSCGSALRQAYHYVFCLENNSSQNITVNFPSMTVNGETKAPSPPSVNVPAGATVCPTLHITDMGNSANGQGTLDYNYTYIDENDETVPVSGTVSTGANDLPPCPDCDGSLPTVPDVLGLTEPAARTLLEEAGFVPQVNYDGSDEGTGLVTAQDPGPGDQAAVGAAVLITVNGLDPDAPDVDAVSESGEDGSGDDSASENVVTEGAEVPGADGQSSSDGETTERVKEVDATDVPENPREGAGAGEAAGTEGGTAKSIPETASTQDGPTDNS